MAPASNAALLLITYENWSAAGADAECTSQSVSVTEPSTSSHSSALPYTCPSAGMSYVTGRTLPVTCLTMVRLRAGGAMVGGCVVAWGWSVWWLGGVSVHRHCVVLRRC